MLKDSRFRPRSFRIVAGGCFAIFASATAGAATNLFTNGDFSAGNTGFTSSYAFTTNNLTVDGRYGVGSDPQAYHPGAATFGDHTTGSGLMLIANGATSSSAVLWQQTVAVVPNTLYDFSAFATSWGQLGDLTDPSPAVLNFAVNGATLATNFNVPAADGTWGKFSSQWSSGTASSATFTIKDTNTSGGGNDFAIDDISLTSAPVTLPTNIVNGDFSSGNTGFTSQYTYSPSSVVNENTYAVTTDPHLVHSGGASYKDHTSGSGNMMVINGGSNSSLIVWQETLAVNPNTTYSFNGWAASWGTVGGGVDPSPAQLQFLTNNNVIGSTYNVTAADGQWGQFGANWFSGTSSSVTIVIKDLNTAPTGNDFSLDDLTWSAIPEPGSFTLIAAAGVTTLLKRNRRMRNSDHY